MSATTKIAKEKLIADLRAAVGDDGAMKVLQLIRQLDVWSIEEDLPLPIPMAGPDFYGEVFDVLIAAALSNEKEKG